MKNHIIFCVLYGISFAVIGTNAGDVNFCFWSSKSLRCQKNEFRCLDGQKCIRREWYCNGEVNCDDGSDERHCGSSSCSGNFVSCVYENKCIPKEWICDGYNDCYNRGDERSCERASGARTETSPAIDQSRGAINEVQRWINSQKVEQNSAEKWGTSVDRLALIRYFIGQRISASSCDKAEMVYELNIQMLSRLASMKLEDIPSTELASYINAFLVTCVNPRNFHGYDLIEELRDRVDQENYTNPYVLLALCNAGETITEFDKKKLMDTFRNKHRTFWTGTQAVVVMALACANKQPENEVDSETLREMALELKQHQYRNGTVLNLPTTALVMQALISIDSESDPDNFDETKAFQELIRNQKTDGSFGDIMSTFLVTPVLACKSLVDINSDHCQYASGNEISALENLTRRSGPKIRVQYSVWIGNEKDLERNLILRVPQNMSLYSVMETAAEIDSRFKFEYLVKNRKPYINAISGMRDNPLTGKFWFLYVIENEQATLSNESPADIVPKDNGHYVMWYRRGTWVYGSS